MIKKMVVRLVSATNVYDRYLVAVLAAIPSVFITTWLMILFSKLVQNEPIPWFLPLIVWFSSFASVFLIGYLIIMLMYILFLSLMRKRR